MSKIKVLHYIPGFNVGGIESRLLDWFRDIDRSKVEFQVIKLNNIDDSDKIKEFVELGGKYFNLPSFNFKNFRKYYKMLNKIISEEKPDVIHVHSLSSGLFPLYVAKKNNVKKRIIHSRTTDYLPGEKNLLFKKIIKKLTPRYANYYFACSKEAGIWGIGKKYDVQVIKNGINLPLFKFDQNTRNMLRNSLNINDNDIVIGTICRLCSQKNLFFLIDLFEKLYHKNSRYKLLIVGDGPQKDELISYSKSKGLYDNVIFVGNKSDVWNYYMAIDIFVATSLYEGFGTTAIEAQATGLPTVVSTGFPETVVISDYVYRMSLDDGIDTWKNKIISIKLRDRSENDIYKVENAGYSAKSVAKFLEDFYVKKDDDKSEKKKS